MCGACPSVSLPGSCFSRPRLHLPGPPLSLLWQLLFACCLNPKPQSHPSCLFLPHHISNLDTQNTKCILVDWYYGYKFFLSCYTGPFAMWLYCSSQEMDLFSHQLYLDCPGDLFEKIGCGRNIMRLGGEDFAASHSLSWNTALNPYIRGLV